MADVQTADALPPNTAGAFPGGWPSPTIGGQQTSLPSTPDQSRALPGTEAPRPTNLPQQPVAQPPADQGTFGNLGETLRKGEQAQQEAFRRSEEANQRAQERHNALVAGMGPLNTALATPTPGPPKLQNVAPPPAAMTEKDSQNMLGFVGAMAMIGAIGSKFARIPAEAALTAFGSALKGYQQGNQQQFENSYKQWEANTKATIQNNQNLIDQYRQVLENKKLDIDHMRTAFQNVALVNQDQLGIDQARTGNVQNMANYYNKLAQTQVKLETAYGKLRQQGGQPGPNAAPGSKYSQEALNMAADLHIDRGGKGTSLALTKDPGFQSTLARRAKERGLSAEDIVAMGGDVKAFESGMSATGRTIANLDFRGQTALNAIGLANQASDKVDRGNWRTYNKLKLAGQREFSDPNLRSLDAAITTLANEYAAAVTGGRGGVTDREHAREMLQAVDSPLAFKAVTEQMRKEIIAAQTAGPQALKRIREDFVRSMGGGRQPVPGGTGTQGAPAAPSNGGGGPIKVQNASEANELDPGTHYVTPDGQEFVR